MPKATAATAAALKKLRTLPSPFLLAGHGAVLIRVERRPSQPQANKVGANLSERACPPAVARFRPSPATCDVSILRSRDRRSMDGPGLRRFPLPRPDAVFQVPQDALVWTCWGVLLTSDSCLTFTVYTEMAHFRSRFSLCGAAIRDCAASTTAYA